MLASPLNPPFQNHFDGGLILPYHYSSVNQSEIAYVLAVQSLQAFKCRAVGGHYFPIKGKNRIIITARGWVETDYVVAVIIQNGHGTGNGGRFCRCQMNKNWIGIHQEDRFPAYGNRATGHNNRIRKTDYMIVGKAEMKAAITIEEYENFIMTFSSFDFVKIFRRVE